jgi:GDP-4-dehydro-6-deoxy-D-mannose reductase
MSEILVTGINGFVGHHLAHEITAQGHTVFGVGVDDGLVPELAGIVGEYKKCDLSDLNQVRELPLARMQGVINLAGLAAVGPSFDNPELYMRINTAVLDTICQTALEQNAREITVLAISSGAVYGSKQSMPLTEESATDETSSPYSASKIAMEELAQTYRDQGLNCIVARPFNHIGPGQMEGFLLPDLYKKVTEAKATNGQLLVGNLTTRRDYTDVRDVAKAYVSLVLKSSHQHGIYNVCSGRSISGEQILKYLLDELGYESVVPQVDEKQFRPSDAPDLYGDHSRLSQETGWNPYITIEQTIADFVASKK